MIIQVCGLGVVAHQIVDFLSQLRDHASHCFDAFGSQILRLARHHARFLAGFMSMLLTFERERALLVSNRLAIRLSCNIDPQHHQDAFASLQRQTKPGGSGHWVEGSIP